MNNLLKQQNSLNTSKHHTIIESVFFSLPKKKKKQTTSYTKYMNSDLYFKHFHNPKLSHQLNFQIYRYYLQNYDLIQLKYSPKKYKKYKRKSKNQKLQSIYDDLNKQHNLNLKVS